MKTSSQNKRKKGKRIWIIIVMVVLAAAGGSGYAFWSQKTAAAAQASETSYKTSQVREGNITISISGSGTLAANKERNLGFSTSGTVAEVNVQVSDQVKEGRVLAQLGNLDELQADVNTAQQDLISAQQSLITLQQSASANLAQAQLDMADAQKAVTDAKSSVVEKGWERCDHETLDAYYYNYLHAKAHLESLGDGGGNKDYYLNIIVPAKNIVAEDYATYEYCAGYTDYEINSSHATLSLTEAELQQAKDTLNTLLENNGIDPIDLATAENNVSSAQLALDKAKATLAGATITAPFDGTILSVAGQVGDTAGTSTFVTIADLNHPNVEFTIDETDLDKAAVGEQANVTFDAIPGQTFQGKVVRINPALETSGGYQVATGLIELDFSQGSAPSNILNGLDGTVEIIQSSAKNVLLVPVQALHDLGDGTYGVFVVGSDGQLTMKVVGVGLQDAASAEITSGLSAGDVVSTGTLQTKSNG